jgi:hypothetical protein
MRLLRFATMSALAAVVAFGTGCPAPLPENDGGRDARADSSDGHVNDTGTDTRTDAPVDSPSDGSNDTGSDVLSDTGTDSGPMDAGSDVHADAPMDTATDSGADAASDTGIDATTDTSGIAAVRGMSGTLTTPVAIHSVTVTYVLAAVGSDPAGFFVQASMAGPALFVAVDPATLTPSPAVGDVVSFTVNEMTLAAMLPEATMISGLTVESSGASVDALRQDLSAASDLVSGLDSYDSELVHVEGTIAMPFGSAGALHSSAPITTAGITTPDMNLRLRVTDTVRDALDLAQGCTFAVDAPLWRFNTQAQVSAWTTSDITVNSCPAPQVSTAIATSATSVNVTFDRTIDPASLSSSGSQFTITAVGGVPLSVTAATVAGRVVTLTTGTQLGGTTYTVTVDGTLTDTRGSAIDAAARSAMFTGFVTPAVLRINEFNANITSCDLMEIRVVQGGAIGGFVLRERDTMDLLTFPPMTVATNDFIVVHLNGSSATCNPTGAMNETVSAIQYPAAVATRNYDTAFDLWSTDSGLTATDNVFTLYDATGTIVDAVLAANSATGTTAAGSANQAAIVAAAGQWMQVGGGVPAGGFVDAAFRANAVLDLDGTGTAASGRSIQRIDNNDTNTLSDWNDTSNATWGMLNPGQTAF